MKIITSILFRILLSPIIILVIGYLYFQDTRKAFLLTLYIYTVMTLISLVFTSFKIFVSMSTFNIWGFMKKSIKAISMVISLAFYWISFVIIWGTNFTF